MPIRHRVDSARSLVVAEGIGTITDADVAAFVDSLQALPDLSSVGMYLLDFRRAHFGAPSGEIPSLAPLHESKLSGAGLIKVAVLVNSPVRYGLVRMYAAYIAHAEHEVQPFYEEQSAREWLGLAPECEGT